MAEPLKINTGKYIKHGKVDIDGNIWSVKLPGVGTELRISQTSRNTKLYGARISILDKKIEDGSVTEDDLDKYEDYAKLYSENEKEIFDMFRNMFSDGTKENKSVHEWMNNTNSAVVMKALEDVTEAAEKANSGESKKSS